MRKIALVGNPNCGKTTLFNILTGSNQKVGNWPGVTVEKKLGYLTLRNEKAELVDLPGIYSLEQEYKGIDEKIAFDYVENGNIDLIINIIDGTNLERSLVLTQQLLEKSVPVVLAINMIDVAKQQGVTISSKILADQLEIPVVPLIASQKKGVKELQKILEETIELPPLAKPHPPIEEEADFEKRILTRYHQSRRLINGVVEVSPTQHSLSEKIDTFVLHPRVGVPFFLLMIYLMFTFAVNFGAVFIDFFDILSTAVCEYGSTPIP